MSSIQVSNQVLDLNERSHLQESPTSHAEPYESDQGQTVCLTSTSGGYADTRRRLKAIFIGSVGNLVEWYDFYAYAAFALYFAGAFFPNSDPVVQQLNAALLFAAGFLVRPLGGWLFGYLADHHGRRADAVSRADVFRLADDRRDADLCVDRHLGADPAWARAHPAGPEPWRRV